MTDPLGQSQVIPYMIGLSKKEYEITILSAEKKINFSKQFSTINNLLDQSKITWEYIQYSKRPPVVSTIIDIIKLKNKAKKLHQKQGFSIVHCRSYISAFVGLYMKRKFKTRFIFDMRGFYADERVDGNIWNLKNPIFKTIYKYFKHKEIDFLENADYTVSLTNAAKKIIYSWPELANKKPDIEVIPCCADLDHFATEKIKSEDQELLRKKLGITKNNFVLSYLGSLGTWYMVEEMMIFFKCLLHSKPDARFLLITPDSPEHILHFAKKYNISETSLIIRKADRKDVPQYLSLSNFSLFFIKPVFSKKASSPTKMGEIMGMGIPVICNAGVGDVDLIMNTNKIGILLNELTEKEMNKNIPSLLDNQFKSDIIRETAKKYYSLNTGIELYYSIYRKLLN